MKFKVKVTNGKRCRLGLLTDLQSNPKLEIETPFSLMITKGGSIPHLTKGVYHNSLSKNAVLCTPVQHFAAQLDVLQSFKKGVASFAALPTHPVCAVVQDPTEVTQSGYNESSFVSVWNTIGRIKLGAQKYMKVVEVMRPDWYETLNDADTNQDASRKRVEKSSKNSAKFLRECLNIHHTVEELRNVAVFAPLLGGYKPSDRVAWTNSLPLDAVDGFSLLGLHQNGSTATVLTPNQLRDCVKASLDKLPVDKVTQALGAFSVLSVLELVECGVDIFDSSLAYLATKEGRAFCFPIAPVASLHENSTSTIPIYLSRDTQAQEPKNPEKNENQAHRTKKIRVDGVNDAQCITDAALRPIPQNEESEELEKPELKSEEDNYFEINLKNKRYAEAKETLVEGCQCYTCVTFTKAYIHHLLTVREMLAEVLLMIHNLHQWDLFFATIRKAIEFDRFEQLKEFFRHCL